MKKAFFIFGVLFVWGLIGSAVDGETIRIVTEDYPPYNFEVNGRLTGFSTEVVKAVVRRVGVKADFMLYPWPRAYRMALSNENTLIYTITRKPSRENLFKWVGPITPRTIFLYKLKDREDIEIDSIEDAKRYITGVMQDDGFTSYLLNNGFEFGKNLEVVSNDVLNLRKLYKGRVDLIGNTELYMSYKVKKEGYDYGKLEKAYKIPDTDQYYMAFSMKTSDSIVKQFQEALEIIRHDGTLHRLSEKYLQ